MLRVLHGSVRNVNSATHFSTTPRVAWVARFDLPEDLSKLAASLPPQFTPLDLKLLQVRGGQEERGIHLVGNTVEIPIINPEAPSVSPPSSFDHFVSSPQLFYSFTLPETWFYFPVAIPFSSGSEE